MASTFKRLSKEQAKKELSALTKAFGENLSELRKKKEQQIRIEYIDAFFELLGWDVRNKMHHTEHLQEVIYEDSVDVETKRKAPDYGFQYNEQRKFFVEAKKVEVNLKDDISPAFQVRRYGFSGNLKVSLLTDFEEFAVYDTTFRPLNTDKASVGRLKYLTFDKYIENFDFFWNTFSHEAVENGLFDKYAQSEIKKGAMSVDKDFVKSLNIWRESLAVNILKNNAKISEDDLNYAVTQLLDRVIFLRICEDKNVEPFGILQAIAKQKSTYINLCNQFRQADQKYNSGLFNFEKDTVTEKLRIDDATIKTFIDDLYYPCPYEFSVMPIDILGNAYEQFLGKSIQIEKGKIKIDDKEDVRKAGGVFYTPQYIVQYILKNTLGVVLQGKTPDEVSKITVCDPSCGSGSFLVAAYEYLLNWHLQYYINNPKAKDLKGKLTEKRTLTTAEKKRILLNNIHGVDIDHNAVEVTKLSLMLQCLDGETFETIDKQMLMIRERVLPSLENNILCGNSLLDLDFESQTELLLNTGFERKGKSFNWQTKFKNVFKNGGFDVIIGNPPYGAELPKEQQDYFNKKFNIGNTDTAALFMVLSQRLLKNQGHNGYIIPKSFTYASNWAKTREVLLPNITQIVDCSKVWSEVKLEMTIYLSEKGNKNTKFVSCVRENENIIKLGSIEKKLCDTFSFILNGVTKTEVEIALKVKKACISLNDVVSNQRGAMLQKEISETGTFNVLGGKQVQRYFIAEDVKGKINKSQINDEKAYIKSNPIFVQRIVAHVTKPKSRIIITATIPTIDKSKNVIVDTINQLQNKSVYDSKFILALLNSNFVSWYAYRFIFANAVRTMQFDNPTTEKIPFPNIDLKNAKDKKAHDEIVKLVDKITELIQKRESSKVVGEKSRLQELIDYTEMLLNKAVYEIYGLSEAEIQVIEN